MLVFTVDMNSDMEMNVDCHDECDPFIYLKKLCKEGASTRWSVVDEQTKQRLDNELDILHKRGLDSFFLILMDTVQYAKSKGIYVGPGRGALPSSAVAYSLGITEVDPFKYELLFERYLSSWMTSKEEWIDFEPTRQREVFEYVNKKYCSLEPKLSISVSDDKSCIADIVEIDIIGNTLRNISKRMGTSLDIYALDYSDQYVFDCVGKGYLNGFSLLSGYGIDKYLLGKTPRSLEDLIAYISLKPDRLDAWANNEIVDPYVKACMEKKESIIDSNKFKEITKNTRGLLLYHEQIIHVFEEIAGFSPEQANEARRSLCKKSGIEEYRIKFVYGCKEEGIPGCLAMGLTEEIGEKVYKVTSNMARYCFNKSHSAAMAILIYQFLWLKYYYPNDMK